MLWKLPRALQAHSKELSQPLLKIHFLQDHHLPTLHIPSHTYITTPPLPPPLKACNSSLVTVFKKPIQGQAFSIVSSWLYASPWSSVLMVPPAISDLIHAPASQHTSPLLECPGTESLLTTLPLRQPLMPTSLKSSLFQSPAPPCSQHFLRLISQHHSPGCCLSARTPPPTSVSTSRTQSSARPDSTTAGCALS